MRLYLLYFLLIRKFSRFYMSDNIYGVKATFLGDFRSKQQPTNLLIIIY